jgi:hypothetical protein
VLTTIATSEIEAFATATLPNVCLIRASSPLSLRVKDLPAQHSSKVFVSPTRRWQSFTFLPYFPRSTSQSDVSSSAIPVQTEVTV